MRNSINSVYSFIHYLERSDIKLHFSLDNLSYWPIVRNCLQTSLMQGFWQGDIKIDPLKFIFDPLKNINLKDYFETNRNLLLNKFNKSYDFLFLYESSDLVKFQNNRLFSRYKDPYFLELSQKYKTAILTQFKQKHFATDNLIYAPVSIGTYIIDYFNDSINFLSQLENLKNAFIELNKVINKFFKNESISCSLILLYIFRILFWKNFYKNCLRKITTQTVLNVCYFRFPQNYGMCAAANELNLPFIDIQHGLPSAQYLDWSVKFDKCPFLPSHYLTWDDIHTHKLKSFKSNRIRPITGIDLINHNHHPVIEYSKKRSKSKFTLLYIDQGNLSHSQIFDLKELFLRIRDKYNLIYRFHPLSKKEYIHSVQTTINLNKLIFHYSEQHDLDISITKSDIVLTSYSSCALKVRKHNKITIFNSTDAKVFYPKDEFFIFKNDNIECFEYLMGNDPISTSISPTPRNIDLGKVILNSLKIK